MDVKACDRCKRLNTEVKLYPTFAGNVTHKDGVVEPINFHVEFRSENDIMFDRQQKFAAAYCKVCLLVMFNEVVNYIEPYKGCG